MPSSSIGTCKFAYYITKLMIYLCNLRKIFYLDDINKPSLPQDS